MLSPNLMPFGTGYFACPFPDQFHEAGIIQLIVKHRLPGVATADDVAANPARLTWYDPWDR